MDSGNRRLSELELEKLAREFSRALRQRIADRGRRLLSIPRVFSNVDDESDADDAPDAFVTSRLRPRHPLRGSAIAVPEPDPERDVFAVSGLGRSRAD
jgi:hypothetical protein